MNLTEHTILQKLQNIHQNKPDRTTYHDEKYINTIYVTIIQLLTQAMEPANKPEPYYSDAHRALQHLQDFMDRREREQWATRSQETYPEFRYTVPAYAPKIKADRADGG